MNFHEIRLQWASDQYILKSWKLNIQNGESNPTKYKDIVVERGDALNNVT